MLREKFVGEPEDVMNFMYYIATELREVMAELGFRTVNDMVGRVDKLEPRKAISHWKASGVDLSALLWQPPVGDDVGRYCQIGQDHGLDNALDRMTLLELAAPALERKEKVKAAAHPQRQSRGGHDGRGEVTRCFGPEGLPEDTIHFHFQGSAGQSFGAFIPQGLTLELEGDANDYFGKGLSGGKLIAYPATEKPSRAEENIIIGNVALYALDGEAHPRCGRRAFRRAQFWCQHRRRRCRRPCLKYDRRSRGVLGQTGRNFAAGMSGGIAYVLDWSGDFATRVNKEMVSLEALQDAEELRRCGRWYRNMPTTRIANWRGEC